MKEENSNSPGWKMRFHGWLDQIIARKWFDVGLRSKMSVMVTIGLIGLISIFAFIAITNIRQATQRILNEHVFHARILAGNLDSNLGAVSGLLTILSSQIDMDDPEASLQQWNTILEKDYPTIHGVFLFDVNKKLIASTTRTITIDWEKVSSLQAVLENLTRSISTEGIPRPYAIIAVPVIETQGYTPTGVMAALLDLSNPDIFLSSASLGEDQNGALQILDGDGQILTSTQPEQTLSPETKDKIISRLFVEGKPTMEACLGCAENGLEETGIVLAFAPLSQAPWGVVIWHDTDSLFAPVRRLGVQTLVLGAFAILGAFFLVMVTTQSVIAPVQVLTDATRKISEEQFDVSTLKSVEFLLAESLTGKTGRRRDEIGTLSNSFIIMCKRLQLSMDEIQSLNHDLDLRVQARTRQLSTLNAVAITVNQSLNLKDILDRALDEVLQLTEIDIVAIFLQDANKGNLKLSASRGLSENAARLANQVGLLDNSCGGVMELGKAVVVPDLTPYRGKGAESLKREKVTALMHVPLMTKGYALGSMCVGTRGNMQFADDEQSLLTAIGNQIAIAVENARLYAEVQRKERLRGELFTKALVAQEDERKRIARELHDEVSQSLTALLYEAEGGLEKNTKASTLKRMQNICDLTQHIMNNIHKLIFDLRPSMLDQLGLLPAVRWLAETRLESKGIRVTVTTVSNSDAMSSEGTHQRLSPEIEIMLYRIIQEAINNIARHAAARNVEIKIELEINVARVFIKDDGIGFDLMELNTPDITDINGKDWIREETTRGLGLIGMQERIELMRGELDIQTALGNGTRINICVPFRERSLAYD
jgi:signal transduction histidine kinase